MITKIKVENLTVFEDMEMDIDANVNVIIGENGTGKTHLLKFINMGAEDFEEFSKGTILKSPFMVSQENLIRDIQKSKGILTIFQREIWRTCTIDLDGKSNTQERYFNFSIGKKLKPVFIPAKDMLTHSPNFLSWERDYTLPFDKTLIDIIAKASFPRLKEIPEIAKNILPKLEKAMDGIVIFENEEFFILKNNGQKYSFAVEAEGMKKIGLIWSLLMSGRITKDSVLLWDEPEANINPKLIPVLADIILELGRNGVQIFLATHDYFLPKYLEVLAAEQDKVAFHALYKTENGVKCESDSKFSYLDENAIIEERIKLYRKEIEVGFE